MPKLSIVVPFYNVEPFFEECLDSLARQTLHDLQVIMVDDGSLDGSSVIAKAYADRDPRFVLVQQENQGLGPARNTGVRHATGEYLAFADSDDVVTRHAYEMLVGSLEKTGSDFAAGNVHRLAPAGTWQSHLHVEPFKRTRMRTHVTRCTELLQDRTAWNKVFRRSFWNTHGLKFPGRLYEDGPVMIRAHVLAKSVDMHSETVYHWRAREGSITNRKAEPANIEDRMESVREVHEFLASRAPKLAAIYAKYALDVDLTVLVEALSGATDQERARLMELGAGFLDQVHPKTVRSMPALRRLRFHLLGHRMLPELLALLRYEETELPHTRLVQRRGLVRNRWYAEYPYFEDAAVGVPLEVFEVTDEIKLWSGVDSARWIGTALRVEGHAYFGRVDAPAVEDSRIRVWLREPRSGRTIKLPVERLFRPAVTAKAPQSSACYDWSGFAVEIDAARLRATVCRPSVTWEIYVEVEARGLKERQALRNPATGRMKWVGGIELDGVWMQPIAGTTDGAFVLRAERPQALVTASSISDGVLDLEGHTADDFDDLRLAVVRRYGQPGRSATAGEVLLNARQPGRTDFQASLELGGLVSDPYAESGAPGVSSQLTDLIDWNVTLDSGVETKLKLKPAGDGIEVRGMAAGQEFALTRTRYGNLRLVERSGRPVVSRVEWRGDELLLAGDYASPDHRPAELTLRRRQSRDEFSFPITWDGDGFSVRVPVQGLAVWGERLPLESGRWDFLIKDGAPGSGQEVTLVVQRDRIAALPTPRRVGTHEYAVDVYRMDSLTMRVTAALGSAAGQYAQRRIQRSDYPHFRRSPLRDLVVFESFRGKQCSDSPRAICEELLRRESGLECVWATRDGQFKVPEGARAVLQDSEEHYRLMAEARYVVTNEWLPQWFVKRPGQTYLQTWHGTPLKRIGFDVERPRFAMPLSYPQRFAADRDRWDVLLSPNPFTTPIMRRAFRYEGEILESGYPRNDVLRHPDCGERAAAVRRRLGVPAGRRVVLYAPTWRDDEFQSGCYGLDFQLDLDHAQRVLGEDTVLLVRGHVNVTGSVQGTKDGFALDVTKYPDIAELYLAADVLVTDYSSVMFDFAVTGKPMLFFTYDLERYRDEVRGFYFDFEAEAPGPLLRTSDQVVEALRHLPEMGAEHTEAYAAFTAKFCPLDDGSATDRVLAHVFGR